MAKTEVESILREIRERVVAQQRHSARPENPAITAQSGNGAGKTAADFSSHNEVATQNLALINSYLTTTGRAWDRLPPLVSNRSGFAARIELWIKRQFKRATRWYSWEQVNFNAAVHQALRDLLPLLSTYEEEFTRLHSQLATFEARQKELEARLAGSTEQLLEQSNSLKAEITVQHHATETLKNKTDHRLAALEGELRERIAALQEEQRVCFKQLSLETSEAAVLEDRARRKTEALLEEVQRRMNRLEK